MTVSDGSTGTAAGVRPTVVVGVDGSTPSRRVLLHAIVAAGRRDADLEVVSSVAVELYYLGGAPMALPDVDGIRMAVHHRLRALVDEVREEPDVASVPGTRDVGIRLVISERPPAAELVERSREARLLVVGSRGRGAVRSALLGSVALHCASHATCPVLVVHASPVAAETPSRVVVGVDGSAGSRAALAAAIEEAAQVGGFVEAVTTYVPADYWTDLPSVAVPAVEEIRERALAQARETVGGVLAERGGGEGDDAPDVRIEVVQGPAGQILTERSRGAHLLVVGSRGRGAFRSLLLGSIALRSVMHAQCPVMVVRPVRERADAERSQAAMADS
jgi:nucleotide-binding universal stress UspA family protein